MHTLVVLAFGFVVLGLFALGGALRGSAGIAPATLLFLPAWFIGASVNMYMGVKKAGYSLADEAPIFLLVYAIPAAAALVLWWKLR